MTPESASLPKDLVSNPLLIKGAAHIKAAPRVL
jgi:hypothetical protein